MTPFRLKNYLLPAILGGALLLLFVLSRHQPPFPILNQPAPAFQLDLLKGGQLAMNDLKGKSVLLYFFASW